MPVDPDLARLLEATAVRAEQAAGGMRQELRVLGERLAGVEARLDLVERRSGALVVEHEAPDGTTTIEAKKTGTPATTILAVLAIFVTPVTVALIQVLGHN